MTEYELKTAPTPEDASSAPDEASADNDRWEQCAAQVVRALPRLRMIATHAVLLSPVVIPITANGWGGIRGC
jgi:hypothetical protein